TFRRTASSGGQHAELLYGASSCREMESDFREPEDSRRNKKEKEEGGTERGGSQRPSVRAAAAGLRLRSPAPCAPHMVLLRHISIALTAAVAALGSALFIALNFFYKRRVWSPQAEYCTIKEPTFCDHSWTLYVSVLCPCPQEEEERGKRQVLVLACLDGAGKSSMLQGLTPGESAAKRGRCRPTHPRLQLHEPQRPRLSARLPGEEIGGEGAHNPFLISEIGGGEDLRRYWSDYLRRTHVLVYVVDSSDRCRFPLAKAELHRLLRVEPQLPVVVLGNKQDKPNAVSVSELHEALSLGSVTEDRKLFLLAAQLDSDGALRNSRRGLDTFQDLLLQLV
ncbi:hypothetical protein L3Q82_022466, partial [Scortum barcoo]